MCALELHCQEIFTDPYQTLRINEQKKKKYFRRVVLENKKGGKPLINVVKEIISMFPQPIYDFNKFFCFT